MGKKKKGARVLIVDDKEIIREVLSYALIRKGFITEDAKDGKEALQKVAQEKPDIIILDVVMPRMDGIQVYERLRESPDAQDIPIIFLSDQRHIDQAIRDMPGENIEYIEKPFDIEYLYKQIDNLLLNT